MKNWEWLRKRMNNATNFYDVKKILECVKENCRYCCYEQWLDEQHEEKKYIIHRTLRKTGEEVYVNNLTGFLITTLPTERNLYGNVEALATIFTLKKAIEFRDILNESREGKQYIWVISERNE